MNRVLNLKFGKKNLLSNVAICILMIYSFSQLSWGNLIPQGCWQILLILSMLTLILNNFINNSFPKIDTYFLLSSMMIAICIFWNNQDIVKYGWFVQIYNIIIYFFYWSVKDKNNWHNIFIKFMIFCGIFYTVWTFICSLYPSIYYNFVYPLMEPMGYIKDVKSGFTANYGTNGLYMCIGLSSMIPFMYFNGKFKPKIKEFILTVILLVGMLLCGKRGQFIAIVFALLNGYYFYNTNKKQGRIIKLIGFCIISIIILYVVSVFIPSVLTIIERFQEQIGKGDISTGRFTMWNNAWNQFLQSPFIGHGWRWFRYSSFTLVNYDVHNVFLQLLTEVGIVGSSVFFIFIFSNIYICIKTLKYLRLYKRNSEYTQYLTIALVYEIFFIVMCATGTALYQFELFLPYMGCCAIVQFYSKLIKKGDFEC